MSIDEVTSHFGDLLGIVYIRMMRKILSMPGYTLSVIVMIAILYLTLVPRPLPDLGHDLFEGVDKVVHALMFLGLSGALGLDYLRSKRGGVTKGKPWFVIGASVMISIVCGGLIELAQGAMNIGRGEDFYDFLADVTGAVIAGIIMIFTWRSVHRWWWQSEQGK